MSRRDGMIFLKLAKELHLLKGMGKSNSYHYFCLICNIDLGLRRSAINHFRFKHSSEYQKIRSLIDQGIFFISEKENEAPLLFNH